MPKPLPVERGTRARELIASALRTLEVEAAGLTTLASAIQDSIGRDFVSAVELIRQAKGRVIVTGMGKSGHIARKSRRPWPRPGRRPSSSIR